MARRAAPVLHRDNPDKEPLSGHVKVTPEDWLNVARDLLISEGVAGVKVLAISERLGVSRSSFYWYFKSRKHLLQALLDDWEARNTEPVLAHCRLPAENITWAVCNFFRCFVDPDLFDASLDFAVREWSRHDGPVRSRIDAADTQRLAAVTAMFAHHGYETYEAEARARILYFMQCGYHALEVREPMQARTARLEGYLLGFTGTEPDPVAVAAARSFAESRMPA
ncbi:TetR/AcrR family transcriptional regulator [Leisingera sp. S232]|uniref:TetR/AcrR family transcriptional regulator n=1 Tax=Leisingera sp. S232 TaxID=3415132 RepID=UPI003C7BCF3E